MRRRRGTVLPTAIALLLSVASAAPAGAQPVPASSVPPPAPSAGPSPPAAPRPFALVGLTPPFAPAPPVAPASPAASPNPLDALKITPTGYVEAEFSYNFNDPSNGITNFRGFDDRHDTFTLSNVLLGASWEYESVSGRLTLQVGNTPNSYYASEPALPGSSGAGATDASTWKYIQEAYVGWKAPVGRGIELDGGIFLSPIGVEQMAVKDDWNWSRSNLFFGLPFYHTGIRALYLPSDRLAFTAMLVNGWNSVVDNNAYKSIIDQVTYKARGGVTGSLLYMGGVERPTGAPEGQPWRHLFDGSVTWDATSWLSVMANGDAGLEKNRFGTSSWAAGALYARVQPVSWLYLAARGDRFWEWRGATSAGEASAIFWPVPWVSSGTVTADFRPHENFSFRVEYRHDQADGPMFFKGQVAGDGSAQSPYLANASAQDTMTAGVTAWF